MDRSDLVDLGRSAAGCAVVEALLHWFPWNRALGDELRPPLTYVIGLIPILGFSCMWADRRRRLGWLGYAAGLMLHILVAGLAVMGAYWLDGRWACRNVRIATGGRGGASGR